MQGSVTRRSRWFCLQATTGVILLPPPCISAINFGRLSNVLLSVCAFRGASLLLIYPDLRLTARGCFIAGPQIPSLPKGQEPQPESEPANP